jgi:hypothetical protein
MSVLAPFGNPGANVVYGQFGPFNVTCGNDNEPYRNVVSDNIGFRCCAP